MYSIHETDIFGCMHGRNGIINFEIGADTGGGFPGQKLQCECADYRDVSDDLEAHNSSGRNVSFVVNSGGYTDASITKINAHFATLTEGTLDEKQQRIDGFPLEPSMVVRNGEVLHAYYFIKDGESAEAVRRFPEIQKRLAEHLGGDPAYVNKAQAMPIPNFYSHDTGTPVMVECIDFHPERRYTQDQLAAELPELDEEDPAAGPAEAGKDEPPEKKSGTKKGLHISIGLCSFLQQCRDSAAVISDSLWDAMISILAVFEGGTDLIHELSRQRSGYTVAEIQHKINQVLEGVVKPMDCQAICGGNNFSCQKFASGECDAISPADLGSRKLRTGEIRDIMRNTASTSDIAENAQEAETIVKGVLFNQDRATATAIINCDIRNYFRLPVPVLKSLESVYKDASKEYQASLAMQMPQADADAPEWYVPKANGAPQFRPGVLATRLAETLPVIYAAEQYYQYQNGVYREISDLAAQRLVQEKMIVETAKSSQILDAERQWRMKIERDPGDLNPDPYIINVRNGLHDIRKGTLDPHTPAYLSINQLNVNYDETAACPLFKRFLEEAMDGDMEQVALLQQMLGYVLVPLRSSQKFFVMLGPPACGKSVLLRVINEILLGRRNVSNVPLQDLHARFKVAELYGRLCNIFADLSAKDLRDTSLLKALTGEDYVIGERKNKNPFSFQNKACLLFSCNLIPKISSGSDEGVFRRMTIIPFGHAVPKDERDPHLVDKFRAEADGIFMFALDGLRGLMENDYMFSETRKNAIELEKYKEETDPLRAFVNECCVLDATQEIGSTYLYNAYKAYCDDNGLMYGSHKAFVEQLKAMFDVTGGKDTQGNRDLKGINLGATLD